MKYGIIVCPKCKASKIVDLNYKTSKCNKCNKIIALKKVSVLKKSDSQHTLRHSIGIINAKIDGKQENFNKK